MFNLKNLFRKRRELLIDKSDLVKTLTVLSKNELTWQSSANMKIGNCGWLKAPDCWFIFVSASDAQWASILTGLKELNVKVLPETTGY